MVDDVKSQMHRFRHLIGFKGYLDVTSAESMKRLIDALTSKYKNDIQKSLHLHRLQLYYDLQENHFKKQERRKEKDILQERANLRQGKEEKPERNDQDKIIEMKSKTEELSHEIVNVRATDIDDWKDLLTLSKIYYVLEHPRSEGLKWKRQTMKRKKIDRFRDIDLIEWRVAQNFQLRGLEEWAQCKSDAYRLKETTHLSYNSDESEDEDVIDCKVLDKLLKVLDPYGRSNKTRARHFPKDRKKSVDRPFKFQDEDVGDWIESYSEDSDNSDIENLNEKISYKTQKEVDELDDSKSPSADHQEDTTGIFAAKSEFSAFRDPVFEEMDQVQNLKEWFEIYKKVCPSFEKELTPEEYTTKKDEMLHVIAEDSEDDEKQDKVLQDESGTSGKETESSEENEKEKGVDESVIADEQKKNSGKQEKDPEDTREEEEENIKKSEMQHGKRVEETSKEDPESNDKTPNELEPQTSEEEEKKYQAKTESEDDEVGEDFKPNGKNPEKLEPQKSDEMEYQANTESEDDEVEEGEQNKS